MTAPDKRFWHGRRVLVTGHTGFKGSWLACWLIRMGAHVSGLALPADASANLYKLLDLTYDNEFLIDLRDAAATRHAVDVVKPQIVLHLAAQALVRRSYVDPVESIATNVLGTAHLLDALRNQDGVEAIVVVTSDKAYANPAYDAATVQRPFIESDPLGGRDPYSASKGAQEIVARSFAQSFFKARGVPLATARAGNVIGGGDWAEDRLMTDVIRSLTHGQPVTLRNPNATRPWQHVMEPVAGYLLYAEALTTRKDCTRALNFGPGTAHSVAEVVDLAIADWPGAPGWKMADGPNTEAMPEAATLALDASLAATTLGWRPVLDLTTTVKWVTDWHRAHLAGNDMPTTTRRQIDAYEELITAP